MARRMPRTHAETRAYMREICAILAAGATPARIPTADEEADRAISSALACIQTGAPYGYMAGARLEAFRSVEALGAALASARALELEDLDARTAKAVLRAGEIAEPWRGRWE